MALIVMPDRNIIRKIYFGSQFHRACVCPSKEGVASFIEIAACRTLGLLTAQWFRKQRMGLG